VRDLGALMARVRVASVSGTMTPELAAELLEELSDRARPSERADARNQLLREAAGKVSGSLHAKAKRLESEARAARAGRRSPGDDVDGVRPLVWEAHRVDPDMPAGWRQLMRIIHPNLS
jgi:hypothetical protein